MPAPKATGSARGPSLRRYWARLLVGVVLSVFLGEEIAGAGVGLLDPGSLIGLLMAHLLIISVVDDLVVRLDLTDRDLLLVGTAGAFAIGGVADQEFYETDPSAPFTAMGFNVAGLLFQVLLWGFYLIWTLHILRSIVPRRGRSSRMGRRGWAAQGILFAWLIGFWYLGNLARPERAASDLFLLGLALIPALWLAWRLRRRSHEQRQEHRRQEVERSRPIFWIAGSYFLITVLAVVVWGKAPLELILLPPLLVYFPVTVAVLARRRVAI